jgi:glutaredoxin
MQDQRPISTRRLAAAIVLAALACSAGAQQVFRIIGPDGKVTFSDQPPADPKAKAAPAAAGGGGGTSTASLPFELRQVANRYPVVLYTGPDCGPCGSGRSFLSSRGVPFAEKTVSTIDDVKALQRLSGAATLPFLTIGGQQLNGYSETEWTQFLNAAGYPGSSQLPASYRPPAPTPLVAVAPPPAAGQDSSARAPSTAQTPQVSAPTAAPGSNPAGIQF